jgi:acid phosphatase (class A)
MRLRKNIFLSLALAASLSGCGGAQFYLYQLFGPDHHYVAAAGPAASVPPPPTPGSPEDRKDLEVLSDWQARRTSADCAGANAQARADYDKFFGDVSPFPQPLPSEVSAILFRVYVDGSKAVALAKKKYARPRPFRRNKALKPCLGRVSGLSYPSGHATVSRLFALLLGDVAPARAAEFLARSERAALNRVIGGVHHPTDIEAGKLLGSAVYAELVKTTAYRADLEKLRALARKPQP